MYLRPACPTLLWTPSDVGALTPTRRSLCIEVMKPTHLNQALLGLLPGDGSCASVADFTINLDPSRMLNLINLTQLPTQEEYPGLGAALGIDLNVLESLQQEWTTSFDWSAEQAALNKSVSHRQAAMTRPHPLT
jgi:hypothetical protein